MNAVEKFGKKKYTLFEFEQTYEFHENDFSELTKIHHPYVSKNLHFVLLEDGLEFNQYVIICKKTKKKANKTKFRKHFKSLPPEDQAYLMLKYPEWLA